MNSLADKIARDAAKFNVGRSDLQPDLFKIKFRVWVKIMIFEKNKQKNI